MDLGQQFGKGVFADEHWVIDRVLPAALRETVDDLRRGRLLVIATLILSAAAAFFAITGYQSTNGINSAVVILGVGVPVAMANLGLVRVIGLRSTSVALCVEHVLFVWTTGVVGAGVLDASLWWLAPAPLVATLLLGSRAGLVSGVAASVLVAAEFILSFSGAHTFAGVDEDFEIFVAMAAITVFAAVSGLAYANERARARSESRVDDALTRLQEANDKLSQVAAALTTARDQAVADGARKTAFLDDMRRFSVEQTQSLSRARANTERLTNSIGSIAASVDVLADTARASSGAIDAVASSAHRVQGTSATLVSAVGDAGLSLGALRDAVTSVQNGYAALRRQAEGTAQAMGAMERSSQAVRTAAERTATLSSGVIEDAERGAQAVTRSKAGVDEIRQTAIHLQTVMEDLVTRIGDVDRILNAIDEVTAETNVLALNASIIAAQAGEQGRGFGVVAEEIKGLAARVASSTRESSEVVTDVKGRAVQAAQALRDAIGAVDAGETLSHEAGLALDQILRSAAEATSMAKSIEGQTVEQASQSSSVRNAMTLVMREVESAARATADHKAAADRIADAIAKLGHLAPELSAQATDQARGAQAVRAGTTKVAAMTDELRSVQREQTAASQQVLTSVDDVLRAQEGVDAALKALRTT